MTRRKQPRGKCAYCGKEFVKGGMLGHLPACRRRKEIVAASDRKPGAKVGITHLRVTDHWRRDFWLDPEMQGLATLRDLDQYLRRIWLECCGHLSMFSTGGWGDIDEIPMTTRIDQALQPGVELVHIYDFGTSSETVEALPVASVCFTPMFVVSILPYPSPARASFWRLMRLSRSSAKRLIPA